VVGGADADGFGRRSRAPSPRTSLDREAEVSATGRETDVKPPSPRDEVRVPVTLLIQLDVALLHSVRCSRCHGELVVRGD